MILDTTSRAGLERVPYGLTLRTIGSFFDRQHARCVNVLETPEGFSLRFQQGNDGGLMGTARFTFDQLCSEDARMSRKRSVLPIRRLLSARREDAPVNEALSGGYQDILRAIGAELDDIPAYDLTLDEVGDALVVSYLFLDARINYVPFKRLVVLHATEKHAVLTDAVARRHSRTLVHGPGRRTQPVMTGASPARPHS